MKSKIKKNLILLTTAFAVVSLMFSCVNETPQNAEGVTGSITVIVGIEGGNIPKTRADVVSNNDMWSTTSFEIGDVLGFYSSAGNSTVDEGRGPILNLPLECTGGATKFTFQNDQVGLSYIHMQQSEIYMYYPYYGNMPQITDDESDSPTINPGMTLRKDAGDGIQRCVDFLTQGEMNLSNFDDRNVVLGGTFTHAFSELIITRGNGFDNPPEGEQYKKINVVMTDPITHIRINYSLDPWSCRPELYYDPSVPSEDAAKWEAWQGGNFGITDEDPIGKEAWYVILPSLSAYGRTTSVEYIELYDNDGNLQKVTALKLAYGNTKNLTSGWRYPMEIVMNELVPTVNPFPIQPWEGDTDITNQRTRGISNPTEFGLWAQFYASYLKDGSNETDLLKYGDKILDESTGKLLYWHFYLLSDIDLEGYNVNIDSDFIIPELKDIIDGKSTNVEDHEFLNYQILNLSKPFVNSMSGYGAIQNIDFEEPYINISNSGPVGTLANSITDGGSISNCNINNGTLLSTGPVGMGVGEMEGGTVSDCSFSGFMIGTESFGPDYIFGIEPDPTSTVTGNESNVIFRD